MARDLRLQILLSAVDKATGPLKKISGGSIGVAKALKETEERLKALQRQQRDISSFRTLGNAGKQIGDELKRSQDRVRELARELGSTSTPTKKLSDEFRKAVREAQGLKTKHQEQQTELHNLRTRLNDAGISTRNLGDHERRLQADINSSNTALRNQENALRRVAEQQRRLAKAKSTYEKTRQVAGSMAGAGARGMALGSGGLYAASRFLGTGIDFDATMSRVQAFTRLEKDDERLAMLRTQARELGESTLFTSSEVAEGQAFLGIAGFDPKSIHAAMPGLLDMAKAGDVDLGRTADIASNILGGFGIDPNEMGRVADILTKAFTTSNTTLEMLGNTMEYVGPVARTAGMSLEETAAMAGLLGNVGIQANKSGTTLRAMLLRLSAPTSATQKAMEELGVSAKDSQGDVRNIIEVLSDVAKATEQMGSSDRLGYLKAIFGEEPAAGMAELLDKAGTGGILEYLDVIKDYHGASAKTAAVIADNLKGDLDQLKSAWAGVSIELFLQNNSAFRELATDLTAMVRSMGAWVRENPELASQILKVTLGVAAFTAAMGALTLTLASILGPFAVVRYAMTLFTVKSAVVLTAIKKIGTLFLWLGRVFLFNPIGLAITALAAAGWLLYRNWDGVIGGLKALWQDLGSAAQSLWKEVKAVFGGGLLGVSSLILNWSPMGLFYKAFAGTLKWFGVELPGNLVDGLIAGLKSLWPRLMSSLSELAGKLPAPLKKVLGIHSPSRVFAALGDDTMAGLKVGIDRSQNRPLTSVLETSKQLAKAGALTLSMGTALPALAFDNRPPMAMQSQASIVHNTHLTINVQSQPGMDERALAKLIAEEVQKVNRTAEARARSALFDRD